MKKSILVLSAAAFLFSCSDPQIKEDIKMLKEDLAKTKEDLEKLKNDNEKLVKDAAKVEKQKEEAMEGAAVD